MRVFSYHRHAAPLRSLVRTSNLTTAIQVLVVVVLFFVLPAPWSWGVLGVGLVLAIVGQGYVLYILRKRHRLRDDRLDLSYGVFEHSLPLASVARAERFEGPVPEGVDVGRFTADYRADEDTLYLLPDRTRLVLLVLAEARQAEVRGHGPIEFTRVVVSVDEPDALVAAVAPQEGGR